ncbi:MAG: four helix bundle protein [Spirochaetales bacterium]|nr:four helix bundle protein [Spirochaetales bacterium]
MSNVEELLVYQLAHELTLYLYNITKKYPKEEIFGLTSQIRRAVASINTNLSEGSHRSSRAEYKHFVNIARGSVGELKYLLLLSKDLEYLYNETYNTIILRVNAISKMLYG